MTYFKDLSKYTYQSNQQYENQKIVNVGWLDIKNDFPTGNLDIDVLNTLKKLSEKPKNICRGFHECDICISPNTETEFKEIFIREKGNGEIHITDIETTYIAPVMIVHFIEKHNYLPPIEFINAIKNKA